MACRGQYYVQVCLWGHGYTATQPHTYDHEPQGYTLHWLPCLSKFQDDRGMSGIGKGTGMLLEDGGFSRWIPHMYTITSSFYLLNHIFHRSYDLRRIPALGRSPWCCRGWGSCTRSGHLWRRHRKFGRSGDRVSRSSPHAPHSSINNMQIHYCQLGLDRLLTGILIPDIILSLLML